MVKKYRKLPAPIYFALLLIYLETVFHIFMFGSLGGDFIYILLFSSMAGGILGIFTGLAAERINYIIALGITFVFSIFFCAQIIYHAVFGRFLAIFSMMSVAGQAFDFMDVITKNMAANMASLLFVLFPAAAALFGRKKGFLYFPRQTWKRNGIYAGIAAQCYLTAFLLLNLGSGDAYSSHDIYYHNVSTDMTVEHFGVVSMTRLDGWYAIAGRPGKSIQLTDSKSAASDTGSKQSAESEIDTSPNIMNIDFDAITASAPNQNVVQLTEYFQSRTGTDKNKYTGMFEDYNVIFVTAEGFSRFVIDEERTPTLYRLKHDGFIFSHYYTPPWYASTSDGEYANLTGLLPADGIVSMKQTGENGNNMYFTLGRQLERLDYTLNGYHNNSYTYYGRDLSHPNMGYNWHGTGNWFQPETNDSGQEYWPQSDLELIEQSMADYMDNEPFHTYYMSVSGHMMYDLSSNQMAYRNYDLVSNLPYSETAKGYLASQMELEKAMSALVAELEDKGISDRTVIVLSADHIPYDDKPVCDELAGHELESAIEWYENDLIIWSGSMEESVAVDKYCYDVDILPTISNLLGLEYDSRLLIGQDILSDAEQLVCFPDRSFISGKCIYNASNGTATPLTEEEVTQEYLDNLNAIVYNKFIVSEMILNEDYYRYLEGNAG